jgi:hypothetical protein
MVLITMIAAFVGAEFITDATNTQYDVGAACAAFLVAFIVYWMDAFLRSRSEGLTIVDDETGESVPFVKKHDLYWIPMKYWPHINCVIGVWFTASFFGFTL